MVDINEYERIVRQYRKALFRYCYYRLNEDINLTEETFDDIIHVLYKKWDSLDFQRDIRSWLFSVADIEIKQALRRYKRYYTYNLSLDESLENGDLSHIECYDEYFKDDTMQTEEYVDIIKEKLPDDFKDIFNYRYIEKKTLTETSELTGIPYSTLRLRLAKLEKTVKNYISKIFNGTS